VFVAYIKRNAVCDIKTILAIMVKVTNCGANFSLRRKSVEATPVHVLDCESDAPSPPSSPRIVGACDLALVPRYCAASTGHHS